MNLRDLEYVVAVADHGHFGRAAAACNVSQPTLSGQILKLEAELGLRLFDREGRGARVSDRAATVVAQARATLAAAAGVSAAADAARDPFAGELRLGRDHDRRALPAADRPAGARPGAAAHAPLSGGGSDRPASSALARRRPRRRGHRDRPAGAPSWRRSSFTTNLSSSSFPVIRKSAGAPRSASRRSIRAPFCCWLRVIVCAIRPWRSVMRRRGRRSAPDVRGTSLETLRHLASAGQGATLAPLLAYADWRRSGAGIAGLKIVGDGASRLVRLIFKRGSPREAALEAVAASLRSTAGAALTQCLARNRKGSEARLGAGRLLPNQTASRRHLTPRRDESAARSPRVAPAKRLC